MFTVGKKPSLELEPWFLSSVCCLLTLTLTNYLQNPSYNFPHIWTSFVFPSRRYLFVIYPCATISILFVHILFSYYICYMKIVACTKWNVIVNRYSKSLIHVYKGQFLLVLDFSESRNSKQKELHSSGRGKTFSQPFSHPFWSPFSLVRYSNGKEVHNASSLYFLISKLPAFK